jgi:hypothetical protein
MQKRSTKLFAFRNLAMFYEAVCYGFDKKLIQSLNNLIISKDIVYEPLEACVA